MDRVDLGRGYSIAVLVRMALVGVVAAGLAVWQYPLLNDIFLRDQLTPLGIATNGFILLLFAAGVGKMVAILVHYAIEERALGRFLGNLEDGIDDPVEGIDQRRVIHRRYRTLARLAHGHSPINHGALASALVADESTRTSFPRFVANILILTGVFGTVLGLSLALVGASDMLEARVDSGGMGVVVHGMSTALSTTITAIVCYLYFGYFHLKLNDVQTRFLSSVEQITTTWLVPRFEIRQEGVMSRFAELLLSIAELVKRMERSQRTFESIEITLLEAVGTYRDKVAEVADDLKRLEGILRAGFRLPDESAT